jgi:pyruvate-ferredoxin/flavodoxin oxidoreductase
LVELNNANFVACHQFSFMERYDILKYAKPGGKFLLNSFYSVDEVWDHLPFEVQEAIIQKKLHFYVIDANKVAQITGMGARINTIMQSCFFGISGVLPTDEAIRQIKKSIEKTYKKRGEAVIQKNFQAVDLALQNMFEVQVPEKASSKNHRHAPVPANAPQYVKDVLGKIMIYEGDTLPVSALSVDGTYPSATTQWEKRNITLEIPVWEPDICIQCGKCSLVCPHGSIRQKVYHPSLLSQAPETFKFVSAKFKEFPGDLFTLQVSPEDCTGCGLCVETCPAKSKTQPDKKAINLASQIPLRESESKNWEFFMRLPDPAREKISFSTVKNSQLLRPLFEFSGACSGCGETPYVKLLSQLFGDHALIANATGCSSVYGGSLPTTPWAVNDDGRGPAWSNSLFEDNAEFGLGMLLTTEKSEQFARELVQKSAGLIGERLVDVLLNTDQTSEVGLRQQRANVAELKKLLQASTDPLTRQLLSLSDRLIRRSVWIVGGDGWAYDIGFGGLDHVLASGRNINALVLDTEVYSNTGGQASKATPRAATAKFAANGKGLPKKDLGMIAMSYGNIYVAKVAMGANDSQTLHAFLEAEAYAGPSLIIAYSHCISHGIDMSKGLYQQKLAVQSGAWPLYRFNPELVEEGKNPLTIDSSAPSISISDYAYNETRYKSLLISDEERAEALMKLADEDAFDRWQNLTYLAEKHSKQK